MSDSDSPPPDRDADRAVVLATIYDLVDGVSNRRAANREAIAERAGVGGERLRNALDYLRQEEFIKSMGTNLFALQHHGVRVVESSRREAGDDAAQEASVQYHQTQVNYHGPVGVSQHGDHATAHVTQTVGGADDVTELLVRLREAVAGLPGEDRNTAGEVMLRLEEEAKRPSPSKPVLKSFVTFLGTLSAGYLANILSEISKKLFL